MVEELAWGPGSILHRKEEKKQLKKYIIKQV